MNGLRTNIGYPRAPAADDPGVIIELYATLVLHEYVQTLQQQQQ